MPHARRGVNDRGPDINGLSPPSKSPAPKTTEDAYGRAYMGKRPLWTSHPPGADLATTRAGKSGTKMAIGREGRISTASNARGVKAHDRHEVMTANDSRDDQASLLLTVEGSSRGASPRSSAMPRSTVC